MSTSKEEINQYNAEGNPDGYWEHYHFNGKLFRKGNFINGKLEGLWEIYHENGQLKHKGNCINGIIDGWWEEYDEEVNLTKREFYVNI